MSITYWITVCNTDGTTPLGCCPVYEVEAIDRFDAMSQVLSANPVVEVVSWGVKDEILRAALSSSIPLTRQQRSPIRV